MGALDEYLWIAVVGGIAGFLYGFLIGANDVANAFAPSVAAKSITLKQAALIASIFEFSGAFFLGASVTGTIRSKIVSVDLYSDEPEVLMFGMCTSLLTAVFMLFVATYLGLPVSTTHDIVGCIMGFTIAAKGFDSVKWKVVRQIMMSWILSPLISGFFAVLMFGAVKFGVMKTPNPRQRAYYTFPVVLTVGVGIDLFFILYKGTSNKKLEEKLSLNWVLPTSFGAGALLGLIWIFIAGPIAKQRIEALRETPEIPDEKQESGNPEKLSESSDEDPENGLKMPNTSEGQGECPKSEGEATAEKSAEDGEKRSSIGKLYKKFADNTYNQDLHAQSMHENPRAAQIWDDGEKYDPEAEMYFNYIQVFTACLNSFAHGANDVSNTIAPLSAIIGIYQDGIVSKESSVQKWVLAYGGAAIVIGLILYGYRVMKSIGFKLTLMSPSRGASAGLASSLTVVTASFLQMPVSSTQCTVGAVCGVGLVGGVNNVQWFFLLRVCFGWVAMFITAVILSAGIFSFGAYSPSLTTPVGAH